MTIGSTSPVASIPSPSSGALDLGLFTIHMYGLTLLVAIALCIWITGHRFVARGGDWDTIFRCAVWGVSAGIVGARLYHLATSWDQVPDAWWGPFAIWRGGLGIWGGVALGCLVGGFIAKRSGADVWLLADCLAPGLLVAQAVGRIGNWWNQELYGRPTDLPWGLEIDVAHRSDTVLQPGSVFPSLERATYHPTFLYELIWDLAAAGALVLIGRHYRVKPPGIFALYIALYSFGRFWIELLRIDPAHHIAGVRLNVFVAAALCIVGVLWFVLSQRTPKPKTTTRPVQRRVGQKRVRARR